MSKPILFLDFDHTLFDTTQFYEWLGADVDGRIAKLVDGQIEEPDFALMLYPDTLPFLAQARTTHRLVLLTYTTNPSLQEKKVHGSGIIPYLDDVLMTNGEGGGSGKGVAAMNYLLKNDFPEWNVFVDDAPENISEVKRLNPQIRCVRIDRIPPEEKVATERLLPPDDVIITLSELLTIL